MAEEMVIFTRTYDMLEWLLPKAEVFPRPYRSSITQRMMNAALDFHDALHDAQSQGGTTRKRHLREADAALDKLRVYLRLTDGLFAHVSRRVAELGRLLGGCTRS